MTGLDVLAGLLSVFGLLGLATILVRPPSSQLEPATAAALIACVCFAAIHLARSLGWI